MNGTSISYAARCSASPIPSLEFIYSAKPGGAAVQSTLSNLLLSLGTTICLLTIVGWVVRRRHRAASRQAARSGAIRGRPVRGNGLFSDGQ